MNIPLFIARKYFLSRTRKNFINIIAIISMIMLLVVTAAMVVILSVFNGFSEQLQKVHRTFDSELVIQPVRGKSFSLDSLPMEKIKQLPGVAVCSEVITDDLWMIYQEKQRVVRFKGVEQNYSQQNGIDSVVVFGTHNLWNNEEMHGTLIGYGIKYELGIAIGSDMHAIELLYPKRKKALKSMQSLNRIYVNPSGVFQLERQYDNNYIFIPLDAAETLTNYEGRRSQIEIRSASGTDVKSLKKTLSALVGDDFKVLEGKEQHDTLYKAIKIEKFISYLVIVLVLGIASLSMYIAITMMVVSKRKDIAVLAALGGSKPLLRRIFFMESMLITGTGTSFGLLLGGLICYFQQEYNMVSIGVDSAMLQAFPVLMKTQDFVIAGCTSLVIGSLIAVRPILKGVKADFREDL